MSFHQRRPGEKASKLCRGCKDILPIVRFYIKGNSRFSRCIDCRAFSYAMEAEENRRRSKEHYYANRVKCLASARQRRIQNPELQLLRSAKRRSKEWRLSCNLKVEDIKIPKLCPVLGIRLRAGVGKVRSSSPTLDRIDNNKGYIKGNVVVVSFKANTIKNNATLEELKKVVAFYQNF